PVRGARARRRALPEEGDSAGGGRDADDARDDGGRAAGPRAASRDPRSRSRHDAMKYMERGGFESQGLIGAAPGWTLVLLSGVWIPNLVLFATRLGFTPASIAAYYRGSEAEFRPPRTAGAMLEVTHSHLPMMALVVLLLTHLMIFSSYSR